MKLTDKEFGKYIAELRIKSGFKSQRQFAEACGLSNGTIARIENGTQRPTMQTLSTFAWHLDSVDIGDLLVKAGYFTEEHKRGADVLRYKLTGNPKLKQAQIDHVKELKLKDNEGFYEYKPLYVPILGNISAGQPILADENIEGYMAVANLGNYDERDLFVLTVKGDSMIGSRIFSGDKVLVLLQNEVETGEIAVVLVNGEDATLKRVKKVDGQTILYPDNPKYEPTIINDNKARIIGKVIQVIFEP